MLRRALNSEWFIAAALVAWVSFLLAVALAVEDASLAATGPVAAENECHRPDDVKRDLFTHEEVGVYDFKGRDAIALGDMVARVTGGPDVRVSLVRLVILDKDDLYFFFAFGPDGCYVDNAGLGLEDALAVFEAAGVKAPFGRGFRQLPL